jgi:hypothetical protein
MSDHLTIGSTPPAGTVRISSNFVETKSELAAVPGSLPVGTLIRFLRTIEAGPDEDRPGRTYALRGQYGAVTGHDCKEGHWVRWEAWPSAAFGAVMGVDFEAANKE